MYTKTIYKIKKEEKFIAVLQLCYRLGIGTLILDCYMILM